MTEKQLDELFPEMILNSNSRVRKKCLVVYLRKKGLGREEVAGLLRIDEDTVTNYTKMYDESGLQGLLEENYHQPKSQLEPYTEQLKELFKKHVPHTVNQAIEMIDKETGIRLKPSACRAFLKKMGMKCRRCGVVPGKGRMMTSNVKPNRSFTTTNCNRLWMRLNKANVPFCSSMRRTS